MATPADENKGDKTLETRSKASSSPHSSQLTSSFVAVARARAKAEAARVKLSFANKEADILKKQADQLKKKAELDADLHVLKSEKEVAVAQAEAQAWRKIGTGNRRPTTAPTGRDATHRSNPAHSRVCPATCRIQLWPTNVS